MSKERKLSPVTPEEAAQLLQSALAYCQKAGLTVTVASAPAELKLRVSGLRLVGNEIKVSEVEQSEVKDE